MCHVSQENPKTDVGWWVQMPAVTLSWATGAWDKSLPSGPSLLLILILFTCLQVFACLLAGKHQAERESQTACLAGLHVPICLPHATLLFVNPSSTRCPSFWCAFLNLTGLQCSFRKQSCILEQYTNQSSSSMFRRKGISSALAEMTFRMAETHIVSRFVKLYQSTCFYNTELVSKWSQLRSWWWKPGMDD